MRRLLIAVMLLAPATFAQVTNLHQTFATSTSVTIAWSYSPASTDCTVGAKLDDGSGDYSTDPNPLAFDVDTTKFTSSNDQQSRYSVLQNGTYRQFIVGTELTPNWDAYSSGGYPATSIETIPKNYSRALQQNAAYIVQVTCSSSVVTAETFTNPDPATWTYNAPYPITRGGNYAFATPGFTFGSQLIDPATGILLKEITAPGYIQENLKTQAFGQNGTCTNWTSPASMWDGSGTATYSASTQDQCSLTFGGTAGLASFNISVGSFQFDGYQIAVTGFASTSGEDLNVCFTFNGTSCAGNTVQFALPTSSGTTTLPTTIVPIDETFIPWQWYEGPTPGNSTSGGGNGVIYNQNFGVLVWKASTDSSTIDISKVEMSLQYSAALASWDGGENTPCGYTLIQDNAGNKYSLCTFITRGGQGSLYSINVATGQDFFLGDTTGGADETIDGKSFTNVSTGGLPPFSLSNPTTSFGRGVDSSGRLHVVSCALPASGSSFYATNASPNANDCPSWSSDGTDVTPTNALYDPASMSDSLIDQFTAANNCALVPTSSYPCFTGTTTSSTQVLFPVADWTIQSNQLNYMVFQTNPEQGQLGWQVVFDTATATVVAATNTWSNAQGRWQALHTPHETGDTDWVIEALATPLDGVADYEGPFAVLLTENMTTTQQFACVGSLIPSETNGGVSGTPVVNELSYVQVGDVVALTDFTGAELAAVTATSTDGPDCSGPELTLVRPIYTSVAATHNSGDKVFMWPSYANYPTGIPVGGGVMNTIWGFLNAPTGDIPGSNNTSYFFGSYTPWTNPCNYLSSPFCNSGAEIGPYFTVITSHTSYSQGYYVGNSANGNYTSCTGPMSSPGSLSTGCTITIQNFGGPFAGFWGSFASYGSVSGNCCQTHAASPQYATATAVQNPFEGSDESIINSPLQTCTSGTIVLVTGTLYSCTPSVTFKYKAGPVEVFDGVHPLMDASGPGSSIGGTTSDNYKFCYVYVTGECQAGSTVGTLYANDPNWTSAPTNCNFNGNAGGTAFPFNGTSSDTFFCPVQETSITNVVVELAQLGTADALGQTLRPIVMGPGRFGRADGFSTAHTYGTGQQVLFVTTDYGTDGQGNPNPREEWWTAQIPQWSVLSTPQRDFVPVTVTIPASPSTLGVATALIEFGYDQNAHCTSFGDKCVAVNAVYSTATPFYFETDDTYTRATCSSGCTIQLPAIPNMNVYYQVKLYNSSGALIQTLPMQTASVL